jgi:hypothetical protein
MYIPRLDSSCKYYYIGAMIYRWEDPRDIDEDSVFRLKLTTDVPATIHLSGKLRVSHHTCGYCVLFVLANGAPRDCRALNGQCSRRGVGDGAFVVIDMLGDSAALPRITEDCSEVERRFFFTHAMDRLRNG